MVTVMIHFYIINSYFQIVARLRKSVSVQTALSRQNAFISLIHLDRITGDAFFLFDSTFFCKNVNNVNFSSFDTTQKIAGSGSEVLKANVKFVHCIFSKLQNRIRPTRAC